MTDTVDQNTPSTNDFSLRSDEFHPSAASAKEWLRLLILSDPVRWLQIKEAIASTALSGNRLSEVCYGTISRLESNQPVSDRYLLGLCWLVRDMIDQRNSEVALKKQGKTVRKAKKK